MRGKPLPRKPEITRTKYVCGTCNKEKPLLAFYKSFDKTVLSGKFLMCKECIKDSCTVDGELNIEKVKSILQRMDRPYLPEILAKKIEEEPDPLGKYFSVLCFPKFNKLKWKDSILPVLPKSSSEETVKAPTNDDVKEFFGEGYTDEEYAAMQKKYNFLKNNYHGKTNMHIEALINYVRPQVKGEMATVQGKVAEAKTWFEIAKSAAIAAKINPSQLSSADLQGGLNNFSRLVQAVESEKDLIKIMPRFKYMPQDAPDFIIWCFVNYVRDLKGLPQAEYSDIYQFYDKKKIEYIEQYGDPYGIFDNNLDIRNRDAIKKFVLDYGMKVLQDRSEEAEEDVFGGE